MLHTLVVPIWYTSESRESTLYGITWNKSLSAIPKKEQKQTVFHVYTELNVQPDIHVNHICDDLSILIIFKYIFRFIIEFFILMSNWMLNAIKIVWIKTRDSNNFFLSNVENEFGFDFYTSGYSCTKECILFIMISFWRLPL